jgi:hypothetical protein
MKEWQRIFPSGYEFKESNVALIGIETAKFW